MKANIFFLSLLGLVLLCAGCRNGIYELEFHPPDDTNYELTYTINGDVEITMMGKPMKTTMNTTIASLVHFDTLPDGRSAVKFKYNKYSMGQEVNGKVFSTDSATNEKDSVRNKVLGMLTSMEFNAIIGRQGKLETSTQSDSLWESVEESLKSLEDPIKTQLASALRPMINDDMLIGMLDQAFYVLPSNKVNVGDKWKNVVKMRALFTMNISSEFELLSVKNGIAEIAVVSKISSKDKNPALTGLSMAASPALGHRESNKGFDIMGLQMEANFEGKQKGTIYVDMGTGLMQNATVEQEMEGKVKMNSFEIPMKMKMKNNYRTRKI